jgi:hypothetical protein
MVHAIDRRRWGAPPRTDEVELLLARVAEWAAAQLDLMAVAVVGPPMASGAELLLLSRDPAAFLDAEEWAGELGGAAVLASARRGMVIEHRLRTSSGLELELRIGSVPPPERDLRPLYDPDGRLSSAL